MANFPGQPPWLSAPAIPKPWRDWLSAMVNYIGALRPVTESDLSFSDITTANASAVKHGLLPKLSGNASQYLNGQGGFSTPSGVGGGGGDMVGANNLSELTNAATARTNLGLGSASTKNVGTGSGDVAAGNAPATAEANAKSYADGLVVGLWDDRGNHDASGNVFPSSGGSGTAGAIQKGDIWTISVAGTLGGAAVNVGDTVRALTDSPGSTPGNWAIAEANIGYVPENAANKSASISGDPTSTTKYPHFSAVVTYVTGWAQQASTILGTIAGFTSSTGWLKFTSGTPSVAGISTSDVSGLGTAATHAHGDYATAAQGTTADNALPRSGGTMTGNIAMGGYAITGSKVTISGISGGQTVTTSFVDEYLTSDAASVTWTLPANGTVGQQFVVWQGGAGQITFSAASGATVGFSAGATHTKTARQYAAVTVRCVANSGGSSAIWIVSGATA